MKVYLAEVNPHGLKSFLRISDASRRKVPDLHHAGSDSPLVWHSGAQDIASGDASLLVCRPCQRDSRPSSKNGVCHFDCIAGGVDIGIRSLQELIDDYVAS